MKKKTEVALGSVLTPEQRYYVHDYIDRLAGTMRLRDWSIKVNLDELAADDAYATNEQDGHSRHCEIKFSSRFIELDSRAATQTLVHELVHCHLFEVHATAVDCMEAATSGKAAAVFEAAIISQVECATDALADLIVQFVEPFQLPNMLATEQHIRDLTKV